MDKYLRNVIPKGKQPKRRRKEDTNISIDKTSSKICRQMYIDLGQKSFGRTKKCSDCQMFYVIGDCEDEINHKKYCSSSVKGLFLSGASLKDSTIQVVPKTDTEYESFDRIITFSSSQFSLKAVTSILDHVKKQFESTQEVSHDGALCSVYVNSELKILGCIVYSQVESGKIHAISRHKTTTDLDVCTVQTGQAEKVESADALKIEVSGPERFPREFTVGINLMWVDAPSRRQGIARKLVDAARASVYGTIISRDHVAFSQPTADGLTFARSYVAPKSLVWAYK